MARITHIVAAVALVGGLAIAGIAAADPRGDRHDGPPPHSPGRAIDFTSIDANSDGSLSRSELMARATARIAGADSDRNGTLDRTELAAALPAPQASLTAVFSSSPAERMADRILAVTGNTETGTVSVQALAEHQVNMLLAALDSDRDAALSQSEAEAVRPPRDGFRHGPGGGFGDLPGGRQGILGPEALPPAKADGISNG